MRISKHAEARCHQRGIPEGYFDLIMTLGQCIPKPGQALEFRIH